MPISAPISSSVDIGLPNTPQLVKDPQVFEELQRIYQAIRALQGALNQPFLSGCRSASQTLAAAGVVIFDVIRVDTTGGAYNTSTGLFTAPSSGNYLVNIVMTGGGAGQNVPLMYLRKNGTGRTRDMFEAQPLAVNQEIHSGHIMPLTVGDTLDFYSSGAVIVEGNASIEAYYSLMQIIKL